MAIGAREHQQDEGWGAYPIDGTALSHHAGVDVATTEPEAAYSRVPRRQPTAYREGWLPGNR